MRTALWLIADVATDVAKPFGSSERHRKLWIAVRPMMVTYTERSTEFQARVKRRKIHALDPCFVFSHKTHHLRGEILCSTLAQTHRTVQEEDE